MNPVGIPEPVNQFGWGTPFDGSNCWATETGEIYAFATKTKPPSPPTVRVKSGNLKRKAGYIQDDRAALLALGLHEGTNDPYVPSFQVYIGLSWDRFLKKLENPLLAFAVPLDYDAVPANLSEDVNFNEGHSVSAYGGTLKDEGNGVRSVLVHDPIHGKAKRYPLSVLKAAAEKIAHQQGLPRDTIFAVQARQAIPKPPPPPPPPPPPDPETDAEKIARLTSERDKALSDLQAATDALALAIAAGEAKDATLEDWAGYGAAVRALPVPGETP